MRKIEEMEGYGVGKDLAEKLNEVIRAVNSLKCVEDERPILEGLCEGECFLISVGEDGLLVACNQKGEVRLEKVKESEKTR